MVFSSIPVYLDPPNWQQPNQQPGAGGDQNPQLVPVQVAPRPYGGGAGAPRGEGGCMGSIKPGSMADRARLAKIPQPEAGQKCPRCESTNTKFCYFNNYSLTQPRHFCKTCRRYWTRGGALRNVPVGGGCRRNKRSKASSRSKSPAKAGSSSSSGLAPNSCTTDIIGHMPTPPPQLQILPHLHHIGDFDSTDVGLRFGGIQTPAAATASRNSGMEFHVGNSSGGGGSILSAGLVEQWRLQLVQQQFPLLASLDPSTGVYSFGATAQGIEPPNYVRHQLRSSKPMNSSGTGVDHDQLASNVKMEENHQATGLNLSRNFLNTSANDHHQYWGGTAWSDLPGFSSSSASQLL